MKEFLKLSKKNKREVIDEYSARSGLKFDIVEKDIWVCYVLQKLFSNDKLKNHLVFKGGTCLSKVYSTIDRFSEDVDIIRSAPILTSKTLRLFFSNIY